MTGYVNYQLRYKTNGRFVFVPTAECREYGEQLLADCMARVSLPSYHFHYTSGGHVAALHRHLENRYFFRVDIQSFFYAIRRNRVAEALRHFSIPNPRDKAKWSCVADPYTGSGYVLPIGFVQSPMLASMVVLRSPVAKAIDDAQAEGAFISMYFDDFIGSASDLDSLQAIYENFLQACVAAALPVNQAKLIAPTPTATAFNCYLRQGYSAVTGERVAKFYATQPDQSAISSFIAYQRRVEAKNA